MATNSLADFLEQLEQAGQLLRIKTEVDPELELAAAVEQATKDGNRAVFFERLKGHRPPVVANLLGTPERICRLLDVESLAEATDRVARALAPREADNWLGRIRPQAPLDLKPRTVKLGPAQQVVKLGRDVDLAELPALRAWPLETRRSIRAGHVLTRDPDSQRLALETIPLEIVDRDRLYVHLHAQHDAGRTWQKHLASGVNLPMAVVLGGDPVYALAGARLPEAVDRVAWAGLLRGRPIELVKCRTHELEVPADADIVVEGFLDPSEAPAEGGLLAGDNGYYLPIGLVATMHVTAITERTNPIVPALVMGLGTHEATVIEQALSRMLLPLVRAAVPEVVDYALAEAGGWQNCLAVAIRKTRAFESRKVAAALWGYDQTMFAKLLVLVDATVNVHDPRQVLAALSANFDPARDLLAHDGPSWPLDTAVASAVGAGRRLALDATIKLPGEVASGAKRLAPSEEVEKGLAARWKELLG